MPLAPAKAVFDFQHNQNRLKDSKGNDNIICTMVTYVTIVQIIFTFPLESLRYHSADYIFISFGIFNTFINVYSYITSLYIWIKALTALVIVLCVSWEIDSERRPKTII